jgi:hypothetical protein
MVNNMEESFSQHYEDLKQYIKNAINFGQSREEIERNLINAGWQKEVIDRAFLEIEQIQAQGNQSAYQTPQGAYSWQQTSSFEDSGEDKKGFAIASFILGFLGLVLGPLAGIPGVILGALGLRSSKKGLAIAGIILSIVFGFLLFWSLLIFFVTLGSARNRALDSRIIATMNQLRTVAQLHYAEKETYNGLDTDSRFLTLKNKMKDNGAEILIYTKDKEYCAKVLLPGSKYWYCVDSSDRPSESSKQEPPCSSTHYSCK